MVSSLPLKTTTTTALLAAALTLAALGGVALGARSAPEQDARPAGPAVDLVIVDRDGRFAEGLRPADFTVTVDGARRKVLWLRRVSRGPGAMTEAAMRQGRPGGDLEYAGEPRRTVLIVIDESSIVRGDERGVVQAAAAFLDRLGLEDRVAILRMPAASEQTVALTTDRSGARTALSRVAGQLMSSPIASPAGAMTGPPPAQDSTSKPVVPSELAQERPEDAARTNRAGLAALQALFGSLGRLPGRKVVALFSAGLPSEAGPLVDEAAFAAVSAHVVVYGFGLPNASSALSGGQLERLAAATGGAYAPLGRSPARVVERAAGELGACYVAGLERAEQDGRPGRRTLRVKAATTKGTAVRTAAWLVELPDAGDRLPAAPAAAAAAAGPAAGEAAQPVQPAAKPARSDPELPIALARLFEYADGYERQYSMLVAEEDYQQSASNARVHLRSDLLLVRAGVNEEWVSFRDVFEVDGRPVRDRQERLRRLFLDPSPAARANLNVIRDESARYNVGTVERTANVPLLPLSFLRPASRNRFRYELAGRGDAQGVGTWRIRYTEWAHPTLIEDAQHNDLPVSGSFLIDRVTGAVIESRLEARRGEASGEIIVRYRRDDALGLWVPVEMRESYRQPGVTLPGRFGGGVTRNAVDGRAVYSNFRRFEVSTEEKIAPPK